MLYDFYQTLFKELFLCEESIQSLLHKVSLSKLNDNQAFEYAGVINSSKLLKTLASMVNDKTPGNDAFP